MTTPLFKDLQKLVAQQQQEKARNELYDRLINKPFWIWSREEHKQSVFDLIVSTTMDSPEVSSIA